MGLPCWPTSDDVSISATIQGRRKWPKMSLLFTSSLRRVSQAYSDKLFASMV